jgi:hypothetical protein
MKKKIIDEAKAPDDLKLVNEDFKEEQENFEERESDVNFDELEVDEVFLA